MPFALKCTKQSYSPEPEVAGLMSSFRMMVNDCIRIGLATGASSLKRLSSLSYNDLKTRFPSTPSYYRLTAISKAAGLLAANKKSLR